MSLPDQTPKLPKLPFLAGDALLLGVAWFIVYQSDGPLSGNAIAAVTACVAIGALVGIVPFLTDYARKQDEALDDRQRGLEALARTSSTAAEQISIAANGLNEITELLHRNLKHADQLPHKLQEKIAEFNAQLENTREDEREELEKEVAELRASETERLQVIAERVHKSVGEFAKLEAAAQKQIAERTEWVERANAAAAKAQQDASRAIGEAAAGLTREFAAAQTRLLGEIETKIAASTAAAIARIDAAVAAAAAAVAVTQAPAPVVASAPAAPLSDEPSAPPKRPRKSRREEPSSTEPAPATEPEPTASAPEPEPAPQAASAPLAESMPAPAIEGENLEPAPTPVESTVESEPAAPEKSAGTADAPPSATTAEAEVPPTPAAERPARKRRKSAPDSTADLTLELGGGEFSPAPSDETPVTSSEVIEQVISSDGATRLIATAYIGIGNRLFIRGDGPGLSWDKGVPLQFVSIGKWRWETADATGPIQVKLYKNDEIECAALGTLTLDPGHQQEVTAKF